MTAEQREAVRLTIQRKIVDEVSAFCADNGITPDIEQRLYIFTAVMMRESAIMAQRFRPEAPAAEMVPA